MANETPNFMFKVPNDEEGQAFLRQLRKFSANGLGFRCYGRSSDRKTLKAEGKTTSPWGHNDVPPQHGETIVVYGTRRNREDAEGGRQIFGPQDAIRKRRYEEHRRQRKAVIDNEIAEAKEEWQIANAKLRGLEFERRGLFGN